MSGKEPRGAARVALEHDTGHVYCPNCDHKIKTTRLVAWYLRSIFDAIAKSGSAVHFDGLGTFYAKTKSGLTRLAWRTDSRVAVAFLGANTETRTLETENSKNGT